MKIIIKDKEIDPRNAEYSNFKPIDNGIWCNGYDVEFKNKFRPNSYLLTFSANGNTVVYVDGTKLAMQKEQSFDQLRYAFKVPEYSTNLLLSIWFADTLENSTIISNQKTYYQKSDFPNVIIEEYEYDNRHSLEFFARDYEPAKQLLDNINAKRAEMASTLAW